MTKRVHPAETARKLVGVASGVALVGIVTGFQLSANAQESEQAQQSIQGTPAAVAPAGSNQAPAAEVAPEAVPAPAAPATQQVVVPEAVAPAAPAVPAEVPAPAAVAPAPAPAAPVNGTTAGSGG